MRVDDFERFRIRVRTGRSRANLETTSHSKSLILEEGRHRGEGLVVETVLVPPARAPVRKIDQEEGLRVEG